MEEVVGVPHLGELPVQDPVDPLLVVFTLAAQDPE